MFFYVDKCFSLFFHIAQSAPIRIYRIYFIYRISAPRSEKR